MGFTGDKKLIWTKNKFETYINEISEEDFISLNPAKQWINGYSLFKEGTLGSNLRRKDKEEFDRLYLMWLNTK